MTEIEYQIKGKELSNQTFIINYVKTEWHWKRDIYGNFVREFDNVEESKLCIKYDPKYYNQMFMIFEMLNEENRFSDAFSFVEGLQKSGFT